MDFQALIVTYHRIEGARSRNLFRGFYDANVVTSEEALITQIKNLLKKYSIIALEELVDGMMNNVTLPDRPCVLTFDDGFREAYDVVFPILGKFDLPATFFISSDYLSDTGHVRWLDLYYYLVDNAHPKDIDSIIKHMNPSVSNAKDIRLAFKLFLKRAPLAQKYSILSDLAEALNLSIDTQSLNESLYLNPRHIKEMSSAEMSFGGHSVTHQVLGILDREAALREVFDSIERVRRLTDQKKVGFAYPFGGKDSFTVDTISIVKDSGAMCGCTSMPGVNISDTSLFELKRIQAEQFTF